MYQKERLDNIMQIVEDYGYVTVKYLVSRLHYSNATINRDLNALEAQKRIHRTYGGVEIVREQEVPLPFRYHKFKAEKHRIGRAAARLVKDGETVFIDGATTTETMAEFLLDKKDITVVTNNLAIVTLLSANGIRAICLGGEIVEPPCMLSGSLTVENAMKYHVDKMFFAAGCVTKDGRIGEGEVYYLLYATMAENADEIYFLTDHEKLERAFGNRKYLFDFHKVTAVVSDYEFDAAIKEKYPKTEFIQV